MTHDEVLSFLDEAQEHERAEVRTLCMFMAYTGCRISESLEMTADRIDFAEKAVTIRTLKQRGKTRYRSIPVPPALLDALDLTHGLRKAKKRKSRGKRVHLWTRNALTGHPL